MSRIVWQARSPVLHRSFAAAALEPQASGGNAYKYAAMRVLAQHFDFTLAADSARRHRESGYAYWRRLARSRPAADLLIKDPTATALGGLRISPVELAVVHHIDYALQRASLRYRWLIDRLIRRLPQMTAVVAVSEFWREELYRLGCRDVEVIYNAVDPAEFDISTAEREECLQRLGLRTGRPLIYIGNGTLTKGVAEVYAALKDAGYTLVMTGAGSDADLPVPCFKLARRDYLCLLSACDVVITMSRMIEGWNRVAQEAMLCGTPVIGSGRGGMRELLTRGGQVILAECTGLPAVVAEVLTRRRELGESGRRYARQLDMAYFSRAWLGLVTRLLDTGAQRRVH